MERGRGARQPPKKVETEAAKLFKDGCFAVRPREPGAHGDMQSDVGQQKRENNAAEGDVSRGRFPPKTGRIRMKSWRGTAGKFFGTLKRRSRSSNRALHGI